MIDPEKKQCWEYEAHDRPHQIPDGGQVAAGEIVLNLRDLFEGF
jgi:hypothetical protein